MKNFTFKMLLIPILFACPAAADDASLVTEARKCGAVQADAARTACYDAVFKGDGNAKLPEAAADNKSANNPKPEAAAPTPAEDQNPGQQWTYLEQKSALDGRTDAYLGVQSDNTQSNSIGSPARATMLLRCMDGVTSLIISFNNYISDEPLVKYRLDDGKIQTSRMGVSTRGDAFGYWSGATAIPFVKSLFGKSKLVLSYDSYSSKNIEFSFDISGMKDKAEPLSAICKWKP